MSSIVVFSTPKRAKHRRAAALTTRRVSSTAIARRVVASGIRSHLRVPAQTYPDPAPTLGPAEPNSTRAALTWDSICLTVPDTRRGYTMTVRDQVDTTSTRSTTAGPRPWQLGLLGVVLLAA